MNQQVEDPKLWDDAQKAQEIMRERQNLELSINNLIKYSQSLEDYCSLLQLAEEEQDIETAQDAEAAIYEYGHGRNGTTRGTNSNVHYGAPECERSRHNTSLTPSLALTSRCQLDLWPPRPSLIVFSTANWDVFFDRCNSGTVKN